MTGETRCAVRSSRLNRVASIRLAFAVVALLITGLATTPAAASTTDRGWTGSGPRQYYLSLGDSFGFGLQLTRFFEMLEDGTYTPDAFNTGYTDDLAAMVRARLRPDLQVVNYSCPATTTAGMSDPDGCFFPSAALDLHDNFTGAQLDAALTFLRSHPGQVSPITLSIGGADVLDPIEACQAAPACVLRSGVLGTLGTNLNRILRQLREAAPSADILLLLPHNLELTNFPDSNPLWAAIVLEMRSIAALHNVRTADAFAAITLAGRTCEATFMCLTGDEFDFHPTDEGYTLMARLFFRAAGYQRL
jgi:lysophospholipase L1-like esterase